MRVMPFIVMVMARISRPLRGTHCSPLTDSKVSLASRLRLLIVFDVDALHFSACQNRNILANDSLADTDGLALEGKNGMNLATDNKRRPKGEKRSRHRAIFVLRLLWCHRFDHGHQLRQFRIRLPTHTRRISRPSDDLSACPDFDQQWCPEALASTKLPCPSHRSNHVRFFTPYGGCHDDRYTSGKSDAASGGGSVTCWHPLQEEKTKPLDSGASPAFPSVLSRLLCCLFPVALGLSDRRSS